MNDTTTRECKKVVDAFSGLVGEYSKAWCSFVETMEKHGMPEDLNQREMEIWLRRRLSEKEKQGC